MKKYIFIQKIVFYFTFWLSIQIAHGQQVNPVPPHLIAICGKSVTTGQAFVYYDDNDDIGVVAVFKSSQYTWNRRHFFHGRWWQL